MWLERAGLEIYFPLMRDIFSSQPDGPRKNWHGHPTARLTLEKLQQYAEMIDRLTRKGRRDGEAGGVPADPRRPNTLSGGAAAALEFD